MSDKKDAKVFNLAEYLKSPSFPEDQEKQGSNPEISPERQQLQLQKVHRLAKDMGMKIMSSIKSVDHKAETSPLVKRTVEVSLTPEMWELLDAAIKFENFRLSPEFDNDFKKEDGTPVAQGSQNIRNFFVAGNTSELDSHISQFAWDAILRFSQDIVEITYDNLIASALISEDLDKFRSLVKDLILMLGDRPEYTEVLKEVDLFMNDEGFDDSEN